MLGIHQKPVLVDKLMIPPVNHDLKLMSIGFFTDDNAPLMWRGPMLHRALEQFLQDVHWGELDVLVVDMPPGTGDVSISLGQMLPRAEAVVVTTPQLLAQEVASRAAEMAKKTGMQLLGVIENMTSEVFGSGGGARLAGELGVPLLGSVPLDARIRESADAGTPLVLSDPDCEPARAIAEITAGSTGRAAPASRALCLSFRRASRLLAPDRHARSWRHEPGEAQDVGVASRMQPCETRPGIRPGLVRAVDADEAAGGPVRQHGRARARAERDRAVGRAREARQLVADEEPPGRRRPARLPDARRARGRPRLPPR